jgi:hypothetical protein
MTTVNRFCIECHYESHLANGGLNTELSSAGVPTADSMSTGSTVTGPADHARAAAVEDSNVVEFHTRADRAEKRSTWLLGSEAGMATAEYAIATLAAVGFAGLLVFILRSDEVRGFLLTLIRTALALP